MITVVLDDDPTGTQAVADVPVVLDWDSAAAWGEVRAGDRAVHVLTNSRAHDGPTAAQIVGSAAAAARQQFPDARFVLRGDSTLRAHLWEEYDALRSVVASNGCAAAPLLLVPALPAAGRVTIDGVHLLERDGQRLPLNESEYARDGALSYSTAMLSRWADERSQGRFSASDAVTVGLDELRAAGGADAVADAIAVAAAVQRPTVVIPDAETESDLSVIAEGLIRAEALGRPALVRCAPAFAATLAGTRASLTVSAPPGDDGVLVVCGSFVPATAAQLEELDQRYPGTLTARVAELAGENWKAEVGRVSREARARIERYGMSAVATERTRDPALLDARSQRRIAAALAQVPRNVPGVVVSKGGITSAVTAREGLDAHAARVIGPIYPGVALWRLPNGRDFVVVPGNVGGPSLLVDLVTMILRSSEAQGRGC